MSILKWPRAKKVVEKKGESLVLFNFLKTKTNSKNEKNEKISSFFFLYFFYRKCKFDTSTLKVHPAFAMKQH